MIPKPAPKDFLKELLINIVASLIVSLIVALILLRFPNINPNTANLLACSITVIVIWGIFFFRSRKVPLSLLPPIIINVIFILVVIVLYRSPFIPPLPTATAPAVIGQQSPVPTATSIQSEIPAPLSTVTLTIEPLKSLVPTITFNPISKTAENETSNPTTPTITLTPLPPLPQLPPGLVFKFDSTNYIPNMFMGSTGDLQVKLVDLDTMTYQFTVKACDLPDDQGYYQWDQLFITGNRNLNPPHFSGILYTDGSFGQTPANYELSGFSNLKWEVRSLQREVSLQFLIGGVKWTWDYQNGIKVPARYPDTIPSQKYGNAPIIAIETIKNDNEWHPFIFNLGGKDLSTIHGGFGWLLSYQSNNIQIPAPNTCSANPPTFIFEIRNVRYEK